MPREQGLQSMRIQTARPCGFNARLIGLGNVRRFLMRSLSTMHANKWL